MAQLPLGTMAVAAGVDETSALVIVIAAAVAGVIVARPRHPRLTIPVVVVELLLGIVIGPQVFDIARIDPTTSLLGDLGLGMLFFFAGYEIDFDRIKGRPLELAVLGLGDLARARLRHRRRARGGGRRSSRSSTPARRWRRPPSGR